VHGLGRWLGPSHLDNRWQPYGGGSGQPVDGNVLNDGLITNLPDAACVEVADGELTS
jgi:hypothetical protein